MQSDIAHDHASCYAALLARDRRFDGRFFVGVTSTGIYCRPVCNVRTPKAANCRFFGNATAAEAAGFRPCLRCRPELAPGLAPIDSASRLAWAAAQRLEAGQLDGRRLAGLAERLGVTDRHLRRVFVNSFGVTPVAWAQTQRLLLAKRLLADTALSLTDIAYASGFGSLRRFNALFHSHYGMPPSAARGAGVSGEGGELRFRLAFRPPFDWTGLLDFLARRVIGGVEEVEAGEYRRSVRFLGPEGEVTGWLSLRSVDQMPAVEASLSPGLVSVLPGVLAGVRRLCDLDCDPAAVGAVLGPLAEEAPGLRVPAAFDGFEMAVRAILGQQITVRAAHTLAGRLAETFGQATATPWPGVARLFPLPRVLAAAPVESLAALGIVRQRAVAIRALAGAIDEGRIDLGPAADVPAVLASLETLPGIGRWTAEYIALRALAWPDAWPHGDVALMKALGVTSAREAEARAEAWRPWRSYATLHLWRRLSSAEKK